MKQITNFIKSAIFVLLISGCSHTVKQDSNSKTESQKAATSKNSNSQIIAKHQIPVLCYHQIADGKKSEYAVSKATFAAHIKILADSGYHSISPDQLYDYLVYDKVLPENPVMITFDDSRAEHFEIAAPTLEKSGF